MPTPAEAAARFLAARRLPLGPGVVAVSGGADSVALLRALLHAGAGPLTVAHLDHGLRDDSAEDARFVGSLCESLGVAFVTRRVEIDPRSGVEEAARLARHDFLKAVARGRGAAWVATGHTADDQAETVLFRALRGTGVSGLAGIPPVRDLGGGVSLVRPLHECRRADLRAWLAQLGQAFRDDPSNADPRFTRNRVRHELLPACEQVVPGATAALVRLGEHAAEVADFLVCETQTALRCVRFASERDRESLWLPKLLACHRLVRIGIYRAIWEDQSWPTRDMRAER